MLRMPRNAICVPSANIHVRMSLKAQTLKSADIQIEAVNREVADILARMDDEIKIEYEAGKHVAHCSVPIHFSIPYMTNSDAQRHVYVRIVRDLKKRGFDVKIRLGDPTVLFVISWLSDAEHREIDEQMRELAAHTIHDS